MTLDRFRWVVLWTVCLSLTVAAFRLRREIAEQPAAPLRWHPVSTSASPTIVMVPVEIFEAGKEPQRREVPVPPP